MAISRRLLLRCIGAAAAGAAAVPAFAEGVTRPSGGPLRLDRNENAYGPSSKAVAAMQEAARNAFRYPELETEALRDAIARRHRVGSERILLGCGSTEIFRMAADTFLGPGKTLIAAQPAFDVIGDCARLTGAAVVTIPLTHEYAHDLAAMLARISSSTGVVYICNPNNPTGTLTGRRDLEDFIKRLPETTVVIIDEAYHHYADDDSSEYVSFIDRPIGDDRVIVTRTFSTIFGLAGLRAGYGVAAPGVAQRLAARRIPHSVNIVAARAAVAALDDREHVRQSIVRNIDDRQEFYNQCHARSLRPIDSCANFVMANTGGPGIEIIEHFRKHNVAIAPSIAGFDKFVRVSLGTHEEMREFWRVWDLMPPRKMVM